MIAFRKQNISMTAQVLYFHVHKNTLCKT